MAHFTKVPPLGLLYKRLDGFETPIKIIRFSITACQPPRVVATHVYSPNQPHVSTTANTSRALTIASRRPEVIGSEENFWLYSKADGYDLTHLPSPTPSSPPFHPPAITQDDNSPYHNRPRKDRSCDCKPSKLLLVTMYRPTSRHCRVNRLLKLVIPSCREAGIPIMWLNWGLTNDDIKKMPPTIVRGFALDRNFDVPGNINGLGSEIGSGTT